MTETPTPAAGEPPTWQPERPAAPAKAPRPARMVKMWHTVVVGVACLIVGLGVGGVFGGVIGYVVGDHGHGGDGHGRDGHGYSDHRGGGGPRGGMGGSMGGSENGAPGTSGSGPATQPQAPSGSASPQ